DTQLFKIVLGEKITVKDHLIPYENFDVAFLKYYIYEERKDVISNFKMDLWKVEIVETNEIREKLQNIETDVQREFGGFKLLETRLINSIFINDPPKERIHIIVQPLSTTGKRKLEGTDEKNEGQESKKVKLVATANKIMEGIMKLSDTCEVYSDPKNFLLLPFPYPGEVKPVDRFAINDDGFFTFMGRKKFSDVLSEIITLKAGTGYMKMFIYGTVGYGKSHILTAIACFLLRSGKRVVYLPDCRELAVDPIKYVKSALFLTYVNDDAKINEINTFKSFDQIIEFCYSLVEKLYFI
ncbi:10098_t:CDS:2, partial [Diversispora eburnea]